MAYATNAERASLRTQDFAVDFIVRFEKNGRQSEIIADDIDHALTLNKQWIDSGASYVEIFRVMRNGELNATIGAYRKDTLNYVGDDAQFSDDMLRATI